MALGLVNCGSENSIPQVESLILDVLVPIITSTTHDRISVGVAIGIALMFLQTGDRLPHPICGSRFPDIRPVAAG